jgi:hypothetical protein
VGIRLIDAPSNRSDDPRARQYIVDHLSPGAKIERRFEVSNSTKDAMTVELYAAAATLHDGAFVFEDGRTANELTGWTSVTPERVSLAPGAKAIGKAAITVPANASGGERYGVIWAELPSSTSPSGVRVVNRVGIRIYLSVGGGKEPPTSFKLVTFAPSLSDDRRPAVSIQTCNDGERAIDLTGDLLLTDGPGGVRAGPFDSGGALTLAPGQCGNVVIGLDPNLPAGPWNATVNLRSGPEQRSASATITFPSVPGAAKPVAAKPRAVTGTGRGRIALAIALLLLLLALLLLFLLWRRRRKEEEEEEEGEGHRPA